MPADYNANEANVPATRDDVVGQILISADFQDPVSVNSKLQFVYDYLQRFVKKAGFLDIATTWTTLQTLTRRLVVSKEVGDANPALRVDGGASVDSLASDGPVSGTTGTFSGAVSGASGAFAGPVGGTSGTFNDVTCTSMSAGNGPVSGGAFSGASGDFDAIDGGTWIAAGAAQGATFGTNWGNGITPPVAVRVTPWGEIQFRGVAVPQASAGLTILTLPAAQRPTTERYGVISRTGSPYAMVYLTISTNGAVSIASDAITTGAGYMLDTLRVSL